jgi:SOS-response transcriptional repressor LexA
MSPSERQLALLRYVHGYQLAHDGETPSYQHCARILGIASKSGVHRLVHGLQDRGLVRVIPGRPASIAILDAPPIPNIGGAPLHAVCLPLSEIAHG